VRVSSPFFFRFPRAMRPPGGVYSRPGQANICVCGCVVCSVVCSRSRSRLRSRHPPLLPAFAARRIACSGVRTTLISGSQLLQQRGVTISKRIIFVLSHNDFQPGNVEADASLHISMRSAVATTTWSAPARQVEDGRGADAQEHMNPSRRHRPRAHGARPRPRPRYTDYGSQRAFSTGGTSKMEGKGGTSKEERC
jgi:hypothetical protein